MGADHDTPHDLSGLYALGALTAGERSAFEAHLRRCVNCQKYLAGYKETIRLGKRAFADDDAPLPPHVPRDLVRAILSAIGIRRI